MLQRHVRKAHRNYAGTVVSPPLRHMCGVVLMTCMDILLKICVVLSMKYVIARLQAGLARIGTSEMR